MKIAKVKSPLTQKETNLTIPNRLSNPVGAGKIIKKIIKKITNTGIVCPPLYWDSESEFAFFPRPTDDFLNSYYKHYLDNGADLARMTLSPSLQATANDILSKVQHFYGIDLDSARVLDYGCGTGWFSMECTNHDMDVYALDFATNLPAYLSEISAGKVKPIKPNELGALGPFLNLISSFDVFEHLSDPVRHAEMLYNSLEPNGIAVISVPNFNSYFFKIDISSHPYFAYPAHLNYFTKKSITRMMESVGFRNIYVVDLTTVEEKLCILPEYYKSGRMPDNGYVVNDQWAIPDNGEHLICLGQK